MLVWLDLETTGLHPVEDHIIEIAAILTDDELKEVRRFHSIRQLDSRVMIRIEANNFVHTMHTESGLLDDMKTGQENFGYSFYEWVQAIYDEHGPVALAGNSIHFDRAFLKAKMPGIEKLFHYRNVDMSTVNRLARMFAPSLRTLCEIDREHHRAMDDIEDSLQTAINYRDYLFTVADEVHNLAAEED